LPLPAWVELWLRVCWKRKSKSAEATGGNTTLPSSLFGTKGCPHTLRVRCSSRSHCSTLLCTCLGVVVGEFGDWGSVLRVVGGRGRAFAFMRVLFYSNPSYIVTTNLLRGPIRSHHEATRSTTISPDHPSTATTNAPSPLIHTRYRSKPSSKFATHRNPRPHLHAGSGDNKTLVSLALVYFGIDARGLEGSHRWRHVLKVE
jgi:hypothetical protein